MFVPKKNSGAAAEKKAILKKIKEWVMEIVPESVKKDIIVEVHEQICGDPSCAPVDTVFLLLWSDGAGKGMFALPLAPDEVTKEDVEDIFPDDETLLAWRRGEDRPWPPLPTLRFSVGDPVECRIGPHPVKGWAPGRIVKLYYSEANWPPNMVAPYQVLLKDGRLIYAPQDDDQLIRLRQPSENPPSPLNYTEYYDDEEEGGDEQAKE